MKIFRVVTLLSMILTLTVATASVVGVAITGFYPLLLASQLFSGRVNP